MNTRQEGAFFAVVKKPHSCHNYDVIDDVIKTHLPKIRSWHSVRNNKHINANQVNKYNQDYAEYELW